MGQGGLGLIKSRRVILNRTTLLNTDLVIGSEKTPLSNDRLRFRLAILNRFCAILLCCDSAHFFASRCGNSGDSKPAIPGIVRFAIRDSVPLRSSQTLRSLCCDLNRAIGVHSLNIRSTLELGNGLRELTAFAERYRLAIGDWRFCPSKRELDM